MPTTTKPRGRPRIDGKRLTGMRIPAEDSDWLDEQSDLRAVSKTAIVREAIRFFRRAHLTAPMLGDR